MREWPAALTASSTRSFPSRISEATFDTLAGTVPYCAQGKPSRRRDARCPRCTLPNADEGANSATTCKCPSGRITPNCWPSLIWEPGFRHGALGEAPRNWRTNLTPAQIALQVVDSSGGVCLFRLQPGDIEQSLFQTDVAIPIAYFQFGLQPFDRGPHTFGNGSLTLCGGLRFLRVGDGEDARRLQLSRPVSLPRGELRLDLSLPVLFAGHLAREDQQAPVVGYSIAFGMHLGP